jgi:malonyl CoA-acyl carrier protein transacylase/NAD(P)-dependent dehydrogenase (short-subunit alcohol dehydrogenase family)
MISLIKALLELEHRQTSAFVGMVKPAAYLEELRDVVCLDANPIPLPVVNREGRMFAAINSFGSWNSAYHLVLERPLRVGLPGQLTAKGRDRAAASSRMSVSPAHNQSPESVDWRIVRLQAETKSALCELAKRVGRESQSYFQSAANSAFNGRAHRLAIVAADSEDLSAKLQEFAVQAANFGALAAIDNRGIFYSAPPNNASKVALLFAGQGSQYIGMLKPLVQQFAPAAQALAGIDEALKSLGYPTFAEVAWDSTVLGLDVWQTQLSILAADSLMYTALRNLGIRPDRIAGHSYGEFPALVAAGAWTFKTAAQATHARCLAIENCCSADNRMLSIPASAETVNEFISKINCRTYISHHNAPRQTVIGGEKRAVGELEELLRRSGIEATSLAVPRPFHTPLMAAAQPALSAALAILPLGPPMIPLLSNITNYYVADPAHIRENLVRQLVSPVNYVDLVRRLADEGVTLLIEVGPRQVLTRLNQQILENRSLLTISCDHPKRQGLQQLLHVQAAYEVISDSQTTSDRGLPEPVAKIVAITPQQSAPAVTKKRKGEFNYAGSVKPESSPVTATVQLAPIDDANSHNGSAKLVADWQSEMAADQKTAKHGAGVAAAKPLPGIKGRLVPHLNSEKRPEVGEYVEPQSLSGPVAVSGLQTVIVCGNSFQRGLTHGQARRHEIRTILRRYVDTVVPQFTVHRESLSKAVKCPDQFFDAPALEELHGIAAGAEVSPESLIAHNLHLLPDLAAGCCHFAVHGKSNGPTGMIHAVNEDVPLALFARNCLRRHVQVNRPETGVPYITFPVAGQVGALSGINSQGIVVTSAMLLDLPRRQGNEGRLQSVIVRNILQQARDHDGAIQIAQREQSTGGWSVCISHQPTDSLAIVEYDGKDLQLLHGQQSFIGSNHSQLHHPRRESPGHSLLRHRRLAQLLDFENHKKIGALEARKVLRDVYDARLSRDVTHPTMNTIRRVDNQMNLVFQPAIGKAWLNISGPDSSGTEDYHEIDLNSLFESRTAQKQTPVNVSGNGNGHASTVQPGRRKVCQRFVLRTVRQQATGKAAQRFSGSVIILGKNPLADAIENRLRQVGAQAKQVSLDQSEEELIAELHRLWKAAPAPHLFLLGAAGSTDPVDSIGLHWPQVRHSGVWLPFKFCQEWFRHLDNSKLVERATLMCCTRQGGDFGLSGSFENLAGSAMVGLIKALDLEVSQHGKLGFRARAVDLGDGMSEDCEAELALSELAEGRGDIEVAYRKGERFVVRPIAETVPDDIPELHNKPTGTWVVTGGARGITAVVARALGKQFGLSLHLLGSSPMPEIDPSWRNLSADGLIELRAQTMRQAMLRKETPAKAWKRIEKAIEIDRNLNDFALAGVKATYHSCDLNDSEQVNQVLDKIRRQSGPINGILHGAGFELSTRFEKKNPNFVSLTIGTKVDAALTLLAATQHDPLQHFIAFSSISGRFGAMGQADYCMANEMLAKLVTWHRKLRPACRATTFHWPAWGDVGMAMRPESRLLLEKLQVVFMPATEGVGHVLNELRAGLPENEILVTDLAYCGRYYPDFDLNLVTGSACCSRDDSHGSAEDCFISGNGTNLRRPLALPSGEFRKTSPKATAVVNHRTASPASVTLAANEKTTEIDPLLQSLPLLHSLIENCSPHSLTTKVIFDPVADPFLEQHRFKGRPQLPAVVALEAIAQAATLLEPQRGIGAVHDFKIDHGWKFLTDEPQEGRIEVQREAGNLVARLVSDLRNRKGVLVQQDRIHAEAMLMPGGKRSFRMSYPQLPLQWYDVAYPPELLIQHGPAFQGLKQMNIADGEAVAQLIAHPVRNLSNPRRGKSLWLLPVLILDYAFFACGTVAWVRNPKVILLPRGIRRLRWENLPRDQETCIATIREHCESPELIEFDFAIFGEDQRPLCEVEGYQCVPISHT